MSENTKIEWADHTFNPWIGCTKVSRQVTGGGGCDGCYAEVSTPARVLRKRGSETWGTGAPRVRTKTWGDPVKWNKQHDAFYAQHGRRQRVFCASLGDVFDNEVDPQWRADLFELIEDTPHLDWLLLTKRIGNVQGMLTDTLLRMRDLKSLSGQQWPWPNVWIGATIVNQAEADRDIPKLLAVPAAKRFLSMEPLLGPVNLADISDGHADSTIPREYWEEGFDTEDSPPAVGHNCLSGERWQRFGDWTEHGPRIDWVIVGGESGPGARPMHPDWARSLRDQCQAAGVAFLFKQWGEWLPLDGMDPELRIRTENHPWQRMEGTRGVVKVGKKAAGRLLDGRTWDGVPT